ESLRHVGRGRERKRCQSERGLSEEVMREHHHRLAYPQPAEEGELVQVLDHHVEGRFAPEPTVRRWDVRVISDRAPVAEDADPVHRLLGRAAREGGREERDPVAARRQTAKDLEAVDLRTARLWGPEIALVQDENAPAVHRRPSAWARRSHQTTQSASSPMRFDSFDSPCSRSMKMIGTSWMRSPRVQVR